MPEDIISSEQFDPALIFAAAQVAIEHSGDNQPSKYDYSFESGSPVRTGSFQDQLRNFVLQIESLANNGDSFLSPGVFMGSALVVAGIIVWPIVGFGVAFAASAFGAILIAAGTVSKFR